MPLARANAIQFAHNVIVHKVHYLDYFMHACSLEVARTSKGPQQSLALNRPMICSVRRRSRKILMTRKVS